MLHEERLQDTRPIGQKLGDAVQSSVQTLLMIGGFIILFSVLNEVLSLLHITQWLALIVTLALMIFQFPTELSVPIISGLFEMTLGSQLVSTTTGATLKEQAIIVSFLLAFAGFSAQAQAASILAATDIRFKPFFFARVMQGVFAATLTFFVFDWLYQPVCKKRRLEARHKTSLQRSWMAFTRGVRSLHSLHCSSLLSFGTKD